MRDPLFRMALVLGLLSAVGPFAIDMYLPALPDVAADLHVSEAAAQLTLTAYFIVFGIAQMIYGPLSDAIGRRKPLMIGVVIFTLATLLASFAPDLTSLVIARGLQALGAATLMVVPRAVIRDRASGPDAARMMAAIMIVISVSPMLAPLTGSIVLIWGSWREIFLVLALASLLSLALIVFVLPETLEKADRQPIRFGAMIKGSKRLLTDRRFMGLTMIGGFSMASFFVFLATASFVYTKEYGMTPTQFSLAFAANAIGFFTASQFAGKLADRFGMERTISLAITAFLAFAGGLAILVALGVTSLAVLMIGLFLSNACLGLVMPTTQVMALDPHPDIAGLASSLGGTIQMLTGGLMIGITGYALENSAQSMVLSIAICAVLAFVSAAASLPRLSFARG